MATSASDVKAVTDSEAILSTRYSVKVPGEGGKRSDLNPHSIVGKCDMKVLVLSFQFPIVVVATPIQFFNFGENGPAGMDRSYLF